MSKYERMTSSLNEESKQGHSGHFDLDTLKDKVKEYIVTPRGMVNSDRTRWKGDLLVGRQFKLENGSVVNDIVLDTDDLAVSRVHFRIFYEDGFDRRADG